MAGCTQLHFHCRLRTGDARTTWHKKRGAHPDANIEDEGVEQGLAVLGAAEQGLVLRQQQALLEGRQEAGRLARRHVGVHLSAQPGWQQRRRLRPVARRNRDL